MLSIEPTGKILGATLRGVDLKQGPAAHDFAVILRALGEYGVLRFPAQWLDAPALKRFSERRAIPPIAVQKDQTVVRIFSLEQDLLVLVHQNSALK